MDLRTQLNYIMIGIGIGIFYTGVFMLITNLDDYESIIPEADAQILPFEQQLEQIRNPQECTRKVVQGKSAEIPFTLKVFYDTTRDVKLEFKQQGTSFPIRQTTNQVMTFFTEEADQYEIYVEVNYDDQKQRQVYIEYLSGNEIVQSEQEKFSTTKFCMTVFVNTVKPVPIPTKEEIFGDSLEYIAQIPAMVTAFNANTQTNASSIAYMWILLFAVLIMAILTLIDSKASTRANKSKMKDLEDTIETVSSLTTSMTNLEESMKKPFNEMIVTLKQILALPQVKQQIPKPEKKSKMKGFMNIIKKDKKKEQVEQVTQQVTDQQYQEHKPRTEADEVLEQLQSTPEDLEEERKQITKQPQGGFIQVEEAIEENTDKQTDKPDQIPDERNPLRTQPRVFKEVVAEIDLKDQCFKEGAVDKFTYNELNECYAWITKYSEWVQNENMSVPLDKKEQQLLIQHIIYRAILLKIKKRNEI